MGETALSLMMGLGRRFEGLRLKAYLCPAGVWTIGRGHTGLDVYPGLEITLEQADRLFLADCKKHLDLTLRVCPALVNESPGRIAALADFVFNLGAGAFKASTLLKKIEAGEWDAVPAEFRKWVHGGGRILPGLVLRREAEIALL